jgi:glutamate N-acetyltransferase / amino-acid N-acetyltransferase
MQNWTIARGYRFAGVHSGLRPDPNRLDLALVVSESPAVAAGVFTQNRVVAAPVKISRERLPRGDARGVIICSGNANACTGQRGLEDARRMADLAAEMVACRAEQMLVCSTGVIGQHLPMTCIEEGTRIAAKALDSSAEALDRAAHAILTTDTRVKVATRSVTHSLGMNGHEVRLTGFAKGAAMIGPNMATMLAFVLSDASLAVEDLAELAPRVTAATFNCISVEGHTSTNDTLLFFANGQGPRLQGEALATFAEAATSVCADLARAIAGDAEGATHLIQIQVEGLRSDAEARLVARTIAGSALVKTAFFGADPNWGRIVSAAGYAGVNFEEKDLSLWLGETLLYEAGTPQTFDAAAMSHYLRNNREVHMRLRFTLGAGRCTFYTSDLTDDYIRLNADYTT